MSFYAGKRLGTLLIAKGLVPEHATNVELHITLDHAVFLRYEVLVDSAAFTKLGEAIAELVEPEPKKS